jgi:hypothetical protein
MYNAHIVHGAAYADTLLYMLHSAANGRLIAGVTKLVSYIMPCHAEHSDGTLRYNAHNLHGAAMAQQHYNAYVAATNKRPFNVIRCDSRQQLQNMG